MTTPWTNQRVDLVILQEAVSGFSGMFGYSPTIGAGNLIFSIAAVAGTDPYGNSYPAGLSLVGSAAVISGVVLNGVTIQASTITGSTITGTNITGGTVTANTVIVSTGGAIWIYSTGGTIVQTFTASGTWVAPAGVTSVKTECWGGGGGGSGGSVMVDGAAILGGGGGGGAGGEYSSLANTSTPGNSYTITVGTGGTGGAGATGTGIGTTTSGGGGTGGNSSFSGTGATTVTATGGAGGQASFQTFTSFQTGFGGGGAGGTDASSGNGGSGGNTATNTGQHGLATGGGGGGSQGPSALGNNAANGNFSQTTGGPLAGGTGGAAVAGGGAGANGGSVNSGNTALVPSIGGSPGGGGGGGASAASSAATMSASAGSAGAAGQVQITYTSTSPTLIGAWTGLAATDPLASVSVSQGLTTRNPTSTAQFGVNLQTTSASEAVNGFLAVSDIVNAGVHTLQTFLSGAQMAGGGTFPDITGVKLFSSASNAAATAKGQLVYVNSAGSLTAELTWNSGGLTGPDGSTWSSSGISMASGKTVTADTWHAPSPLGSNWATGSSAASQQPVRYRLTPDNCVEVIGIVHTTSNAPAATIWTFPAGYQPTTAQRLPVTFNNNAGTILGAFMSVSTAGAVSMTLAPTATSQDLMISTKFPLS